MTPFWIPLIATPLFGNYRLAAMATPDFESEVTQGKAQWLISARRDTTANEFVVELTHDPESPKVQRVIRFGDVRSVSDFWTDRDDGCQEGLLGAHERGAEPGFRYTLVTDQREIRIHTVRKAQVFDERG